MSQPSTGSEIAAEYRADILDTYLVTSMTGTSYFHELIPENILTGYTMVC
ncbi:hypothetical protein EW026_g6272 [Hermanssonia centrifuga]|uniref:Uncharacterized protein n=1 Tax=Hermanssonia centrifuga TaxID=98765 RepID=A0A4S4KBI7_9APHY|nr:hypothetical protein EW026_g6272 [Hermanssonia centrifuga]